MKVHSFKNFKDEGEKITMVTCYDFWSARILDQTNIDCLLVGDSLSMVIYGHPSTLMATTEMMARHTEAVVRGAPTKFVVADMPFPSFRLGVVEAMKSVDQLMKAGAHAVKLEGAQGHEDVIKHIVQSGVPVFGHLGLTPQSIHQMGGFKVQGKTDVGAEHILKDALTLQDLGATVVVLECIPQSLAQKVTESLEIPTIGIGAGSQTDGQVLVLQDLLGMNMQFKPKFLKTYLDGEILVKDSVNEYVDEVKETQFPTEKEAYT